MKELNDKDLFPFGKYKGIPMEEVPADYLDYIDGQKWIDKYPAVKDYITRSRPALDLELKRMGKI